MKLFQIDGLRFTRRARAERFWKLAVLKISNDSSANVFDGVYFQQNLLGWFYQKLQFSLGNSKISRTSIFRNIWELLLIFIPLQPGLSFLYPMKTSRSSICIYQPWYSICVCLFFILQLKCVIVTLSTYINSAFTYYFLLTS